MTTTITEQQAFTWSCRKAAGEVPCIAAGSDREEYVRHMRGHGLRMAHAPEMIRLRKTAPAAVLRKARVPVLEDLRWTEDGTERRGQFWSDGPYARSVWVIPYDRAPGEGAVLISTGTDGAWYRQDAWRTQPASEPEPAAEPAPGLVAVHDVDSDATAFVTRQEAAEGMARYARSLGPGTPACGVYEERALRMARGEDQEETVKPDTMTNRERLAERAAHYRKIQAATAPGTPLRDAEDAGRVNDSPETQDAPGAALAVREGVVVARPLIDGGKVFRYIYTFYKRFAVWGSEAEIVTAALWTMQAHAKDADSGQPVWPYSPRLGIFGPSGSGKSWKSRLIGKLSPAGEILLEPTKPSFLDLCADNQTIVITEADELFYTAGRSRGILAAVNAGYEPDRTATRKHGGKVLKIAVYTPVVLDGLDTMLAATRSDLRTMISRCIVIHARRAPEGYRPPRFDGKARAMAAEVSMLASAWAAQEVAAGMADTVPEVPEHLGNRPFALWEPLFTVALHADQGDPDGPVSAACREACEVLEAGTGLPEPQQGETELDRQMAAWDEEEF